MIVARFAPEKDILAVMLDKEIYDRTNGDGAPRLDDCLKKKPNLSGWTAIGGYVNEVIASLFLVKDGFLHFWVLKPYRGYAMQLLRESFRYYPHDVMAQVPVLYPDVIKFAKRFGFRHHGIKPKSFCKNGKLYDSEIMRYQWAA